MSKYYVVEQIAKAMKPQLVNGIWQKPKLSARRIARIRKECLRYGTINGVQAQWNPEWDKPAKSWIPKSPKGHAFDNKLSERVALIDKNLKGMDKLIEETRKEAYLTKPHTFLDIKLDAEDYDEFFDIGKRVTSKARKANRAAEAAKAAAKAEKAAAKSASKSAAETAKEPAKGAEKKANGNGKQNKGKDGAKKEKGKEAEAEKK